MHFPHLHDDACDEDRLYCWSLLETQWSINLLFVTTSTMGKIQMKTNLRFHLARVRIPVMKTTNDSKVPSVARMCGRGISIHCWQQRRAGQPLQKSV